VHGTEAGMKVNN